MSAGTARRRAAVASLVVAVTLAGAALRTLRDGRRELEASSAELTAGEVGSAIVHARRAASAYVPLSRHVEEAYESLAAIADGAERRGDRDMALDAWRAVRAASMQTRWVVEPYAAQRARADAAIARLVADAPQPMQMRDRRPADLERLHASLLARDDAPRPWFSLLLVAGIAGWVLGAYWMATRGLSGDGRLVAKPAWVAAALLTTGVAAFVVALFQA